MPNKTSIEAWGGRKPFVRHFKVFGCLGYSQTSKERRSTLDVTSESASLWVIVHSQRVIGYII